MRKTRAFTASGFDALESRTVLSHGAVTAAAGVIHGHKAAVVAADFARFEASFNSTIVPLAREAQNPTTPADQVNSDSLAIRTAETTLINTLGNQLARQLPSKSYPRIRSLVTGATDPGKVGSQLTLPSTGSLAATLQDLNLLDGSGPNSAFVHNLVAVYQAAFLSGHSATAVRGDFLNFQHAFARAIPTLADNVDSASTPADKAKAQQALDDEIVTLVNGLGTQLSRDLGPSAQTAIQKLITGQSSSSGVNFTSGTPVAGSLLATLMSAPTDELKDNFFLINITSVYASSSPSFS